MNGVIVETAQAGDAHDAAVMAAAKRAEYEQYSPVFWRVAEGALDLHEPFLASCIVGSGFTSFVARREGRLAGIAIAGHRTFPPPFGSDAETSWLVDDFFVSAPAEWQSAGLALIEAVEDAAVVANADRVIVLTARLDVAKRTAIESAGYERGASWWVRPIEPRPGRVPEIRTQAVVGPAPPVYDPGGLTALALDLVDPAEVAPFEEWAAAANAVLAIVPARASNPGLEAALDSAGYEPASDWLVKHPAGGSAGTPSAGR